MYWGDMKIIRFFHNLKGPVRILIEEYLFAKRFRQQLTQTGQTEATEDDSGDDADEETTG